MKVFKYPNQKNIPYELEIKYIHVKNEQDIQKNILYEGVSDCANQYLIIKENKYFLKDIRLNFEKEIREKEIKYVNRSDYDIRHSQILVCYTDKTPTELNIRYNPVGDDTIKLVKIDMHIKEYKKQMCEKYKLHPPYYYTMYYINSENKLFCTSCSKSNDLIEANEIKRIGSMSAFINIYRKKEKFEDC